MAATSERELKDLLISDGFYVIRSAGSKAIDLVAVNKRNGDTMLVEEKAFWGNTFSVRKTADYLAQWKEMLRIQKEMNGHTGVFYALRKKGQREFRFVRPTDLKKPYHWNRSLPEPFRIIRRGTDGEVHST